MNHSSSQISLKDWLSVIKSEYLERFIRQGGSAVKFVAPRGTEPKRVVDALRVAAAETRYQFAYIDGARIRMNHIHALFNEVARSVDWDSLAIRFLTRVLQDGHYNLPPRGEDVRLDIVADLNGLDLAGMRAETNKLLREKLFRDFSLTHDFRIAMLALCRMRFEHATMDEGRIRALKDWLIGELRLMKEIAPTPIYRRIAKHNARHLLYSLAQFCYLVGDSGLVLALDISRISAPPRQQREATEISYTAPSLLEAYEVLRQVVDSTDELAHCLVVVMTPADPAWEREDIKRGLSAYQALKLRVWDDVFDQERANPMASLVRVTG